MFLIIARRASVFHVQQAGISAIDQARLLLLPSGKAHGKVSIVGGWVGCDVSVNGAVADLMLAETELCKGK